VCNDIGIPVFGRAGSSIHIQEFLQKISKQGVNPYLLYQMAGEEPSAEERRRSSEISNLPLTHNPLFMRYNLAARLSNFDLRRELKRTDAERCQIIHERYSLFSESGAKFANQHDIPFILEVNSPLIHESKGYSDTFYFNDVAEKLEERVFERSDHIIVVSKELKEYFSKHVPQRKITTVPNGVNPNVFSPAVEPAFVDDGFVIGFVGSFKRWHGVKTLVDIGEKLKEYLDDFTFVLVGDGPLREEIEQELKQRGLSDHFLLPGSIPHPDVPNYLAGMDIAIAPYPDLDFFYYSPVKIFEYMAMGLPTLSSNIGQVGRIIDDRKDGFLVEPGNVGEFTRQIAELSSMYVNDRDQFEAVGKAAREKVCQKYTWTRNAEKIHSIYEQQLEEYL